jgi:predicted dehydrogenase
MSMTPPDRRKFLQAAAAALPAASYARAAAGADGPGIALIGCGGRGQAHLHVLMRLQGEGLLRIAGLCDVWDGLSDEYLQPNGTTYIRRQFRQGLHPSVEQAQLTDALSISKDYRTVLDRTDIHAVCIATPDHMHAKIALAALEAGKDVLIERPFTRTLAEAEAIAAKAQQLGRIVGVGVQALTGPAARRANELILSRLGPAVTAHATVSRTDPRGVFRYYRVVPQMNANTIDWPAFLGTDSPPRPFDPRQFAQWRCYSAFAAGGLADLLFVPAVRLLAATGWGRPTRVLRQFGTHFEKDGRDVPDSVQIAASFPGGGTLTLHASTVAELPNGEYIAGRRGRVQFEKGQLKIIANGSAEEMLKLVGPKHETEALWRDFLRCVRERDPATVCPPALAAAAVELFSGS